MNFNKVAIIGLGLLGGSIGLAIAEHLPGVQTSAYDQNPDVRRRAAERGLAGQICETAQEAVSGADLVILCVPVGAMADAARTLAPALAPDAVISDVGSSKQSVLDALTETLPNHTIIPAHPVAGTEFSGPDAGFATLFHNRWCILTPPDEQADGQVCPQTERLAEFWSLLGARVEVMSASHHDLVLAVTSHIPHLIAYTIVGTASDLEHVTQSEVIKYSAGGFRDFTRIAASDPIMWRDIFLANRKAVLAMLDRFSDDLEHMRQAILSSDGAALFDTFTRTRAIRRSIIEQGQDDPRPDFGRNPRR